MAFWDHVKKTDTCWLWIGHIKRDGYGGYGSRLVHRIVYELVNGRIPEGMLICHKCDIRNCVNPDHLFIGTYKDNQQDAACKGRMAKGDRNGTHVHPERVARGLNRGRYTKPERNARGERNGQHTHPERTARGDKVNTAKLAWNQIREIRQLIGSGEGTRVVAMRFGVTMGNVRRIARGKYWKEEYAPFV